MIARRLLPIVVALPLLGWTQEAEQRLVPATLTSDVPDIVAGQTSKVNQLSAAVTVTTVYDDNVQSTRSGHVSDYRFSAMPSIRLDETRPQLHWDLQYEAGVSHYRSLPIGTQSSHAFSGSIAFDPIRHLHVRLRQDYLRSIDPFSIVQSPLPDLGIVNSPNRTIVAPSAVRTVLTSVAELEYALSPHSALGASGTFIKSDYSDPLSTTATLNLMSGQTVDGSLFYSAQLSPRGSVGVQYVVQDMTYAHNPARVQTHSFMAFTTMGVTARSSLMLYGGPELTRSHLFEPIPASPNGVTVNRREWNPAVGAVFSWVGSRTDFSLSAMRRVSDGGGVLDAATMTSGSFSLGRRLSRNWTGRSGITLAKNTSAGLSNSTGTLRSLIATAMIERSFMNSFQASVGYDRVYQDGTSTYSTIGNHNRIQLSLRYSLSRPLGK